MSVRDARRAAGLSQEELAERAGMSARSIGDIERGVVRRARTASLIAIADALRLTERDRIRLLNHHRGAGSLPELVAEDERTPRQLPPDLPGFTGRVAALRALDGVLDDGPPIAVIDGAPGIGKSTLAVHWAHRVRDRFPDGQLYVHLRGYGPSEPMSAEQVLERLLAGIGADVPVTLDDRIGLFRTRTAGKRLLILLDDARRPDQVRPCVPTGPGSLVLVTSRSRMRGLSVRDGAFAIGLDEFTDDEATDLLAGMLGAERVAAEREAATDLARLCAGLPLALRIAGDRAADNHGRSLATVVGELTDRAARLPTLQAGEDDMSTNLLAVFSWSYRALSPPAARLFRLLGLHPGHDLDRSAATALCDGPPDLDVLADAHLVEHRGDGRYGCHDLLRLYATQLAEAEPDASAALRRLFDHYRYTAKVAMDAVYPHERHRRPDVPAVPTCPLPPGDEAAARAWLEAERLVLTEVIGYCAANGWPEHARDLANTLWRHLDTVANYRDALAIHGDALAAARETGDRTGEANALHNLGAALWRSGDYHQALERLLEALALRRSLGDRAGEGDTLTNLSGTHWRMADYPAAEDYLRQALAIRRELGNRAGEAGTLDNLGVICERVGRYPEALSYHSSALEIFRSLGNRSGEAAALDNLGVVHQRLGRYAEAVTIHEQSLSLCRAAGTRVGEGYALTNLGSAHAGAGNLAIAERLLREAIALRAEVGDQAGEATAMTRLGMVLTDPAAAIALHEKALTIGRRIGDRQLLVEVLNNLGEATGDATHHREALTLAEATGDAYERDRASRHL
ncbi:tetratricopeptide (TPR) repeat protein [Labedaea rhizosphaerae]|uniref:Tetratricopeptide (TPR) repeat protein n=1 Tax=Labedaea rhizosphaerae TaxID=598644 RepID=A0A4V3D052_LABRH|nr:tetratricopeptide (TPR) repeat protein [Labedaea rhizosphaerae]